MAINRDELQRELESLRKGAGIQRADLLTRVGPQLRQAFGIYQHDTAPEVRRKITDAVELLLRDEASGVLQAALVGLAAYPTAMQATLGARVLSLAARQAFQPRTARRRIDYAFGALLRAILANHRYSGGTGRTDGWWVRSLTSILQLNATATEVPVVELTERRTIVVGEDGVDVLHCEFSLPRAEGGTGDAHELEIELITGGAIRDQYRPATQHFEYTIELPRRFRAGESHDYVVRYRLPAGQPMTKHYVHQPFVPCESFDVTVCFDIRRLPRAVWELDGVAPRLLDADERRERMLPVDRFGQVHSSFHRLSQGRSYGIKWSD